MILWRMKMDTSTQIVKTIVAVKDMKIKTRVELVALKAGVPTRVTFSTEQEFQVRLRTGSFKAVTAEDKRTPAIPVTNTPLVPALEPFRALAEKLKETTDSKIEETKEVSVESDLAPEASEEPNLASANKEDLLSRVFGARLDGSKQASEKIAQAQIEEQKVADSLSNEQKLANSLNEERPAAEIARSNAQLEELNKSGVPYKCTTPGCNRLRSKVNFFCKKCLEDKNN